jgi:heat shock protein HslJ
MPSTRTPIRLAIGLLVTALVVGACGTDDTDTRSETAGMPSTRQDVEARQWVLDGPAGTPAIEDGEPVTIRFEEDTVGGSAPCNTYGGTLSIEYATVEITDLVTTMMACEPPAMRAEEAWLAALEAVDHAEVDDDGDRLVLTGDDDVRLEFDAYDATDRLPGEWTIVDVLRGDAVETLTGGSPPVLTLTEGGDLSLDTGCGTATGGWEVDGELLTVEVTDPVEGCDEPDGDAELAAAVVDALSRAARVELAPGRLTILTGDHTIAVVAVGDDTTLTEDDE